MTADEPVAGAPRRCARRADCTRPRGHDGECGPDRDQARVARYAAALSSARLDAVLAVADTELADLRAEVEALRAENAALASEIEHCTLAQTVAERDDALARLVEAEGVARTNAAWVQQQHAAAKEAREQRDALQRQVADLTAELEALR